MKPPGLGLATIVLLCALPCRAESPGFSWCADPTRLRQALCKAPDFAAFSACARDAQDVMQCPGVPVPVESKVLEPVEIQVPKDTPKGYNEQIMIME
jgi:hypothetical protein